MLLPWMMNKTDMPLPGIPSLLRETGGLPGMYANQFGGPPQVSLPQDAPPGLAQPMLPNNPLERRANTMQLEGAAAGAPAPGAPGMSMLPMMMNGFSMMNRGDNQAKAQVVNQATSMNQDALGRMQQLAAMMRQRMYG